MKKIELIKNLELGEISRSEKSKEVKEIFKGARRHLIEVTLRDNEILAKHKAAEPIPILCLAGGGTFRAGSDSEEEEKLQPGTLLTLESAVEHEVVAEPGLRLLITKFNIKSSMLYHKTKCRFTDLFAEQNENNEILWPGLACSES